VAKNRTLSFSVTYASTSGQTGVVCARAGIPDDRIKSAAYANIRHPHAKSLSRHTPREGFSESDPPWP